MPKIRPPKFRAGTASIIGLPNAGKSTLLNAIIGEKIAIVSAKPQTTRTNLNGVFTNDIAQIQFVDTPGLHRSDTVFNRRMMQSVREAVEGIDVLVFVVDASKPFGELDSEAMDLVKKVEAPVILVLNKSDAVAEKPRLLQAIEKYRELHEFAAYIPISALRADGVTAVIEAIIERLPVGPAIHAEDHLTDVPSRFLAAEMIREKILAFTGQEVPHAVAVLVDKWEETDRLTRISATIYVERDGQKAIVIGAGGAVLKRVGSAARLAMEAFFGKKIFLEMFVKVKPGWRNEPEFLNELDWRRMVGERDA